MGNGTEVLADEINDELSALLASLLSAKSALKRTKAEVEASGSARTDELRHSFRRVKLAIVKVLFNPLRYGSAEDLNLPDWGAALFQRSFLQMWVDSLTGKSASTPITDGDFREVLLPLLFFPVRRIDKNRTGDWRLASVQEASAAKLWRVGNMIAEDFGLRLAPSGGAEDDLDQRGEDDELPDGLREPFSKAIPGFWWRLLEVDLLATDDNLIQQFKAWLSAERARADSFEKPPKKFTDADRRQWVRHRVLGYIDLLLSARAVGLRLTQQEIADTLFPDQYGKGGDEYIRKTVAPLAKTLMSNPNLDALRRTNIE